MESRLVHTPTGGLRAWRLVAALIVTGCSRPDPWAPCKDLGPVGFGSRPAACATEPCRQCAAALEASWRARQDPAQRAAFRTRFMRISADARETFITRARPDESYPYEHCTAGLATGHSCAAFSDYCVTVIADGLRSATTTLAQRTQYNIAASRACQSPRDAMITRLRQCAPIAANDRCESGPCAACMAGHLAALTVLAPLTDNLDRATEFQTLVDATPEPVARSIAESLGAPEAPADIETVVVQRSLRAYCFSLVTRSESPPPYACNAVMVRFMTHPEYPDAARAWEAVSHARPTLREHVLSALLTEVARGESLSLAITGQLRTLPAAGTTSAVTNAMGSPVMTDAVYSTLREFLVQTSAPGATIPPETRPPRPSVGDAAVPTMMPTAPTGGAAPRPPVAPPAQTG